MGDTLTGDGTFFAHDSRSMAQATQPGFAPPPVERLSEYCQAHGIRRLEVFGSAVRTDFGPESDIDLMVSFEPDRAPGMFGFHRIEEGLSTLFGRKVDLVSRVGEWISRNPICRAAILDATRTIYAAPKESDQ